jgi:hypothetical protein
LSLKKTNRRQHFIVKKFGLDKAKHKRTPAAIYVKLPKDEK